MKTVKDLLNKSDKDIAALPENEVAFQGCTSNFHVLSETELVELALAAIVAVLKRKPGDEWLCQASDILNNYLETERIAK